MAKKPNGFTTGSETRASYAHLLEKVSVNGGKPHYSCSFLIPKSDTKTVDAINKAIAAAYEEGKGTAQSMSKLEVIGIDISSDECIPNVRVYNAEGEELGDVWGERTARLLAEAEEMLRALKCFVDGDWTACMQAHKLIDRIENSPELTYNGLTMKELHSQLINP